MTPKLDKSFSVPSFESRKFPQPEFDIAAMVFVAVTFSTVAALFGAALALGFVLFIW